MINTVNTKPDARCAILLLLNANIITFTQHYLSIEISFILFLSIILIICNCIKYTIRIDLLFLCIILLQTYVLPSIHFSFFAGFTIIFSIARKLIPCLLVGSLLVKRIPSQYSILALRKFHLPQSVLIPLAVTIRYIPTIKTEISLVKDAMRLRNISWSKKAECVIASLIINAAGTADELSAAAVTRGIENPCKKTSALEMKYSGFDYLIIIVAITFTICSLLSFGGII